MIPVYCHCSAFRRSIVSEGSSLFGLAGLDRVLCGCGNGDKYYQITAGSVGLAFLMLSTQRSRHACELSTGRRWNLTSVKGDKRNRL